MKKSLSISTITLSLLLGYSGVASANIWSPSASWGSQTASYAPDYGNTSMYEYVATTSGNTFDSPKARFRFTQEGINGIRAYSSKNRFYTFDISTTDPYNRTLSAYNSGYYCTLPSCKFDVDDDPELTGGNGYNDETEGVSLDPGRIQPNVDYRFESTFWVYSKAAATFEFGSQESYLVSGTTDMTLMNSVIIFEEDIRGNKNQYKA